LFDVGDAAAEEIRASGQVPQETVVVDL
jgi:hypothetical protein